MSCTILALPYAIAWLAGTVIAATATAIKDAKIDNSSSNYFVVNDDTCEDENVISEEHFIEKSFETPFMDKEILIKTLEEHGVQDIFEDFNGNISGKAEGYTLNFEKTDTEKPYFLKISCPERNNVENQVQELNSEYILNVQEKSYLSIIEKLKENNMSIEEEEVMDDNTIVLTVNLE